MVLGLTPCFSLLLLMKVTLPTRMAGPGNVASAQSSVKLTGSWGVLADILIWFFKITLLVLLYIELGPRMMLTLLKIEEGLCEGKTLYHRYSKPLRV